MKWIKSWSPRGLTEHNITKLLAKPASEVTDSQAADLERMLEHWERTTGQDFFTYYIEKNNLTRSE